MSDAPAYEKPHNQQTYEKPHIALREAVEKALDGLVDGWKFDLAVDRILSLLAPPQEDTIGGAVSDRPRINPYAI